MRREWFLRMTAIGAPVSQFYGIQTSNAAQEYSQGIGDFGTVPEYNSSAAEGNPAAIAYDTFNPLYEKTFIHKEYALGTAIERKLWDDNQTGLIRQRARVLGNAFGTTVAMQQASVFNNAFSASFPGPDGVALCATNHPARPGDPATQQANKVTVAFDYAGVVAALAAGKKFKDDRGNPLPSIFTRLVVPIELEAKAYEITNAINKPGTADNDANFLGSQGLQVVVDPYLTSAKNWFLIDPMKAQDHLLWYWRVRPELALDPTSDYNLVAKYRGYYRASFGWDEYRWIYGSEAP
jgi:phage major head subunit gpT-like protein